jgi:hypothetical protein
MTLSGLNVGRFEETFETVRSACPGLTIDDFHLNIAQVSDHYYDNARTPFATAPPELAARDLRFYRSRRSSQWSAQRWLETKYLAEFETYLMSATTPMRCHSLRSSCFIDPWGTVFPCITYNRPLGGLRDHGMRLEPIWKAGATREVQAAIWEGDCPQCWTACEAYHSILGNIVRPFDRGHAPKQGGAAEAIGPAAERL